MLSLKLQNSRSLVLLSISVMFYMLLFIFQKLFKKLLEKKKCVQKIKYYYLSLRFCFNKLKLKKKISFLNISFFTNKNLFF